MRRGGVAEATHLVHAVAVRDGRRVAEAGDGGLVTLYGHMSAFSVDAGQAVAQGQQIGLMGSTGNSTGPHVHFAVSIGYPFHSGSYFVNPLRYY